ncbi:MAG: MBL fold metallo-hydrolase RNA specificity domain-containing protein [Bryobacteraceae bacterium]
MVFIPVILPGKALRAQSGSGEEEYVINALSGHADQAELLEWMKPMALALKKVFLVHGEISQSAALQEAIRKQYGIEAVTPGRGECFDLD